MEGLEVGEHDPSATHKSNLEFLVLDPQLKIWPIESKPLVKLCGGYYLVAFPRISLEK